MILKLWTKKRYVAFYNKRNRFVSFIHKPWSICLGLGNKHLYPLIQIWKEHYVKGQVENVDILFELWKPSNKPFPNMPTVSFGR